MPETSASASPMQRLTEAARAVAESKLGRHRLAVEVRVRLDDQFDLEGIGVEITGQGGGTTGGERLCDSCRDVIALLARTGHRLTTSQILSGLDRQGTPWGESTVKQMLAQAVRDELLDNRPQAKPPGYGLPTFAAG